MMGARSSSNMPPRSHSGETGISAAVLAAMVLLGALAALYFAWPVYRALLPFIMPQP